MKRFPLIICVLCWMAVMSTSLAQEDIFNQKINTWYLEERFLIADQNDDALLERAEIFSFKNEFLYYLEDRHYRLTDLNRDGYLSYQEILKRTDAEYMYCQNVERSKFRALARQYSFLIRPTVSDLKKNPKVVEELFTNVNWMYANNDLVDALINDPVWLANNGDILIALHNNLRWMASNPLKAKNLYRNRKATQKLPYLLAWRSAHKDFIRSNTFRDRFYILGFTSGNSPVSRR